MLSLGTSHAPPQRGSWLRTKRSIAHHRRVARAKGAGRPARPPGALRSHHPSPHLAAHTPVSALSPAPGALLPAPPPPHPPQVHTVLAGLMDRLARYAATDAPSLARLTAMHAFDRFRDAISHILAAQVCVRGWGGVSDGGLPCARRGPAVMVGGCCVRGAGLE